MKNRITKNSKHHGFWVFNFFILHNPSQKSCWIIVVSILLQLSSWASSYEGNQSGKMGENHIQPPNICNLCTCSSFIRQ
jgi:hypothetical protein